MFPKRAENKISFTGVNEAGDKQNMEFKLNGQQITTYREVKGQKSLEFAGKLINSPGWKNLTDEQKAGALQRAYALADLIGKQATLPEHAEAIVEAADEKWKRAYTSAVNDAKFDDATYLEAVVRSYGEKGALHDKETGKTIKNTEKMKKLYQLDQMGLTGTQRTWWMDNILDVGANSDLRKWSPALLEQKLNEAKKKSKEFG